MSRPDNSHLVIAAARRRAAATRKRAVTALRRMENTGAPITFDAVAREAQVSRSWLYNQDDLRAEVERLRQQPPHSMPTTAIPNRQRASNDSLLRRLEIAATRIKHLEAENKQLRDAFALALGEQRAADVLGQPRHADKQIRSPHRAMPRTASTTLSSPENPWSEA